MSGSDKRVTLQAEGASGEKATDGIGARAARVADPDELLTGESTFVDRVHSCVGGCAQAVEKTRTGMVPPPGRAPNRVPIGSTRVVVRHPRDAAANAGPGLTDGSLRQSAVCTGVMALSTLPRNRGHPAFGCARSGWAHNTRLSPSPDPDAGWRPG